MIGHKIFPSRSGGVEVVVYELSTRLAKKGIDVTVYNRGLIKGKKKKDKEEGVNIVRTFTFKNQKLNAMVYSFLATFETLTGKYDIIHYHAVGICVPIFIARLFKKKTVATIHGLNWRVDKWKGFAAKYLKFGEKIAVKYADEIITLTPEMHRYFLDTYGRDTALIENAITPVRKTDDSIIKNKFGLEKDTYIFYFGRISPEKGVLELIEAYNKTDIEEKLVIAGEIPGNEFGEAVRSTASCNDKIVFTGFATGEVLNSLYCNASLYVLPSHTEGLSLSLLEALSCGVKCLTSDIVENTSVTGKFGMDFKTSDVDDLARALADGLKKERSVEEVDEQIKYIKNNFDYDKMVERHIETYERVIRDGFYH